jgi:hypothetical protein
VKLGVAAVRSIADGRWTSVEASEHVTPVRSRRRVAPDPATWQKPDFSDSKADFSLQSSRQCRKALVDSLDAGV